MMSQRHSLYPVRRRQSSRYLLRALLALLLLTLLVACGGNAVSKSSESPSPPQNGFSDGTTKPAAPEAQGGARSALPAATQAAASAAGGSAPSAGAPASAPAPAITVPDVPKQIIKNGTLSLVVKDVDGSVTQVQGIALQFGGAVVQSTNTKSGNLRVADTVIQVESNQFDAAMAALRSMNGVLDRKVDKTTSQDVTEEYVDLKAQIENLQATERQLRAIMDKATRTDDILAIQREITNVRGQIDRLQGRANYLERRAAMSTITLHLEPEGAASTPSEPRWRFVEVVARAWANSLVFFQGFATVLINVAIFALWFLPVILVAWLVWRALRGRVQRQSTPSSTPPAPATPTAD